MKLYKVVTHTHVVYKKTDYIEGHDEEDIKNKLDSEMKTNPWSFTDTPFFEIEDYELEEVESTCR